MGLLVLACSESASDDSVSGDFQMELSVESLRFSSKQAVQTILVNANSDWGVSSSESWCKLSQIGGIAGETNLHVTTATNEGSEERIAYLNFKSGRLIKKVGVHQSYKVEEVAFEDENFKSYCIQNLDKNRDGVFAMEEALSVTELNASGLSIVNLTGLEFFEALTKLDVSNNLIVGINLANLKRLEELNCANNNLQTLDISVNVNLNALNAEGNVNLKTVNVWTGFEASDKFVVSNSVVFEEPEMNTPLGYELVWNDEFNEVRGASGKAAMPDETEWWYETGSSGWGNNEIQNYIAGVSGNDTCAVVSDGALKIIAKRQGSEVLSIRMNTIKSWTYGYFEARLKLPSGKGLWPAFWMMPQEFTAWPADGEIDIMEEVGYDPNRIHSSIHTTAYNHKEGTQRTATKIVHGAEGNYHVYALEWTEDYIKGFVDGEEYFYFENDKANNYDTWPFFKPFYLKLNLAWGGDWGGAQGINEDAIPAVYEIDYVRVFQK